ncbi:MAG: carbonic anhydrase [Thermoleophilia bacterium]|nr:carbonic anhydrase [Thermoleophilia bacterium]
MTSPFADLLAANRSYAEGFALGDLTGLAAKELAVLTCIDSRIEPLSMLGLQPGEAKIVRNAGAQVTGEALRSLEVAAQRLSVRRIMVVAHTDCAMSPTEAAVRADVERLRNSDEMPAGTIVAGFFYDVKTGLLHPLDG